MKKKLRYFSELFTKKKARLKKGTLNIYIRFQFYNVTARKGTSIVISFPINLR